MARSRFEISPNEFTFHSNFSPMPLAVAGDFSMNILLFEDIFEVKQVDPDGKKFDRVSRIKALGENYESDLTLDVNFEIFPMKQRDKFSLALSPSISLDGAPDEGVFDQSGKETLADQYDYVMYGTVYKFEQTTGTRVAVCISFGGLLMRLECDMKHLNEFNTGNYVYLLIKSI